MCLKGGFTSKTTFMHFSLLALVCPYQLYTCLLSVEYNGAN